MNRKIIYFISFIAVVASASIAFTIQYDIYSYHIWAYTAIKEGVSQIYDIGKYFDRVCDYPPLGAYISIFQGKVLSYFAPLKIGSVPMLFFYKLLPVLFIFFLFHRIMFKTGSRQSLFAFLLCAPFAVSTVLNGQFDIIIVFLLLMGIVQMEKKNHKTGITLLILSMFIKQTALFSVFLILLHYFIEEREKVKFAILASAIAFTAFILFYLPFIVKGNVADSIRDLISSTSISSAISGYAFNILSLIRNSRHIDSSYNVLGISILSYSLCAIAVAAIFIALKRGWDIFKKISLFSILWFNFLVGLREQHLLYLFFFISIYLYYSKKNILWIAALSVLSVLNFILYNPLIALALFGEPSLPEAMIMFFSLIQSALSGTLFIVLLREKEHTKKANTEISFSRRESMRFIIFILFIIFFAEFAPGFYEREEKEFLSDAIEIKDVIEISKDRYIDLNVVTLNSFENYLGVRLSDNAYFKVKNSGKYQEIVFDAVSEFTDNASLIVNSDTLTIERHMKNIKVKFNIGDTLTIKALTGKKYSQIAVCNFRYR